MAAAPPPPASAARPAPSPHNLLGLDYTQAAAALGPPPVPIIDAHTHIHGPTASLLYDRARRLYGVTRTYSMTQLPHAPAVRDALGDSIRFIAIPTWSDPDRHGAHRRLYLRDIERFHRELGARMLKIWASPRLRDVVPDGACDLADIDAPIRREHCRLGQSLGMMFMVHVADPDTWFASRYADGGRYGPKAHHYVGLRRMLDDFPSPWIAAHMGGWPEDLAFLDGLLAAHPNLHLDTSATKWIVRELSARPAPDVVAFLTRWRGRVLFGTDLVTTEDQLTPQKSSGSVMADLASTPEQAFELYCSRHWALRTLFETAYDGPSPIADPDLHMVDPARYTPLAAPPLRGLSLPKDLLATLYAGAAADLVDRWWATH